VICSVTLKLSNGYTIVRSKGLGTGLNRYTLIDQEGSELEFNNFGLDVPEEIRTALGFHHLTLDKSKLEVNYIPQMESPLAWAHQGAGLSRLLNKFNNIDDFESLLKRVNKKIHARGEIPTEIKILQSSIEDKSKELSTLVDPTDTIEQAQVLLDQITDISARENRTELAGQILHKYDNIRVKNKEIDGRMASIDDILQLKDPVDKLISISDKVKSAKAMISSADSIRARLQDIDAKLVTVTTLSSIDIDAVVKLSEKIKRAHDLLNVGAKIRENDKKLHDTELSIDAKKESLKEELNEEIARLKICPVCKQELLGDSVENVIRSMSND
jgi:hypothetical protein